MKRTYHGSDEEAILHVGICVTTSPAAAANYAVHKNAGNIVTIIDIDTSGLSIEAVDYDFDDTEPIIPDDCTADIVTYTDSDMWGREHTALMLLTEAAIAAARIDGTITATDAEDL